MCSSALQRVSWVIAAYLLTVPARAANPPPIAATTAPAQIRALEEAILASRRAIRSGVFHVILTSDIAGKNGRPPDDITTYLDGSLVREDINAGNHVELRCYGSEHFYRYLRGPHKFPLTVIDLDRVDRNQEHVHDPTLLMLYASWYLAGKAYNKESLINSPLRTDFEATEVECEGQKAWKVSFTRTKSGFRFTYWVVPSWGHSIVRWEVNWVGKAGPACTDCVRCSVQHLAENIWFPKKLEFRRITGGKVVSEEDLDIEVSAVNQSLPPETFSPVGMSVPADTLAVTIPEDPRGTLKWDGKEVVAMKKAEVFRIMGPYNDRPDSGRRRLYLMFSGAFALIGGAAACWAYLRRQRDAG